MQRDDAKRTDLEQRILHIEKGIEFSSSTAAWIFSKEFREYLDTWKEYVDYYIDHNDETTRGVTFQALSSYLRSTRILNEMLRHEQLAGDHEEIEEVLAELEDHMNTIISEGFARMYIEEDSTKNDVEGD